MIFSKSLAVLAAAALATTGALAADFPIKDKPVTIVVPFAAGGPTDRVARDLAEAMRKPLGATIVVENACLLYTSPSPRDGLLSRMPSSA